jgi:hypothetical protein
VRRRPSRTQGGAELPPRGAGVCLILTGCRHVHRIQTCLYLWCCLTSVSISVDQCCAIFLASAKITALILMRRVCPFKVALLARQQEDTREKVFDGLHRMALNSAGVRHYV